MEAEFILAQWREWFYQSQSAYEPAGHLCPQPGSKTDEYRCSALFLFFLFVQSRAPAHGLLLPPFGVELSSSQTHPEVCLLGYYKSSQVDKIIHHMILLDSAGNFPNAVIGSFLFFLDPSSLLHLTSKRSLFALHSLRVGMSNQLAQH